MSPAAIRKTFSPADRWRPRDRTGPVCGFTFRGEVCGESGAHFCAPRAERVVRFFAEVLVHTKGRWARKRFDLDEWQADEIVRPLFGEVIWSPEWDCYVRRYRIAYIIVARKNGKTEVAAGSVLVLLVGDDEEAAEIYGAASDTKQADKVGAVVERMRQLEPRLKNRLGHNKHSMRTFDERTGSYYELIPADALGELGANPHGFVLDEFLAQAGGDLWDALRTGAGTRTQPLFLGLSTETDDPSSWGAGVIDEAERIAEDPSRAPHVFTFVRRAPRTVDDLERLRRLYPGHPDLPVSIDVFDEANWRWPNPALGSFLSVQSLREEALEAQNEPAKENAFRQFRMNQRVQQTTRWMPLHLWDATAGMVDEASLKGRTCYGGLDLAAISDLTSLCWFFPGEDRHQALWRHFVPEEIVPILDRHTGGKFSVWVKEGFVEVTEGDVVDYDALHARMLADAKTFAPVSIGIDRWNSTGTTNWLQKELPKVQAQLVGQGFAGMTLPMKEIMRQVKAGELEHGGNPVARWCFDSVEVRQDESENIRPVKPDRQRSAKRIDAVASLADAVDCWLRQPAKKTYRAVGF